MCFLLNFYFELLKVTQRNCNLTLFIPWIPAVPSTSACTGSVTGLSACKTVMSTGWSNYCPLVDKSLVLFLLNVTSTNEHNQENIRWIKFNRTQPVADYVFLIHFTSWRMFTCFTLCHSFALFWFRFNIGTDPCIMNVETSWKQVKTKSNQV